ncbi:genetic competence negative regulator [Bacillus alkalicellulosilyticus]|uniref:genetic competence negative regulator n=1 Tax=Alkalihalobacterium alkalicellulosilyticum TaxID=1912214 RepID=UPI0009984561|nr:genetic competence negative regulator [Bacillus alkalicellulosilyticus]
MRLERLAMDKIKIFLTFDDLKERGMTKEDLWYDGPKVHELFREMMVEAKDELGFKADGPIAVEVFSLPAQGMVIIVTKGNIDADEYEDDYDDGYIELQVTLDESDDIFYEFASFEDVIQLAGRLYSYGIYGGTLLSYQDRFFLKFEEYDIDIVDEEAVIALLSEYGNPATLTTHRVHEYGKILMELEAVYRIYHTFMNRTK